jgi:hypothetical protein
LRLSRSATPYADVATAANSDSNVIGGELTTG